MDATSPARSAGVLLHPTSLPGPYGVGDLGPAARAWVDQLAAAGVGWWQVLPVGPTGYGDSPYQGLSAFAGNPLLVSPDDLAADGLVAAGDMPTLEMHPGPVDYAKATAAKAGLLEAAADRLAAGRGPLRDEYDRFRAAQAGWLDDFALFVALKGALGGGSWHGWPEPLRRRHPAALAAARRHHEAAVDGHAAAQFLFFRQWGRLRAYARSKGVRLIGDMPIFVAGDSADVWARPHLFRTDAVAGVPPDYFSPTGQLWGNPLYAWEAHAADGYAWWVDRLKAALATVDLIRLDHFRGFEAYWEVPAGSPTAQAGRWVPGPGAGLLAALRAAVGGLPLIAEDLGVITPGVDALRAGFGLPGMRVLQFAFGGAVEARFLPHNFDRHTVAYTGTHDNDTTAGWFAALSPAERAFALKYLGTDGRHPAWDLIRAGWASVADLAVAPAQDLLGLGSEARMNRPGQADGNWRWRLTGPLPDAVVDRLGDLTALYGRAGRDPTPGTSGT